MGRQPSTNGKKYCLKFDGKFECKFCGHTIRSSMSRMVEHLAGWGNNVSSCDKCPREVREDMLRIISDRPIIRRRRRIMEQPAAGSRIIGDGRSSVEMVPNNEAEELAERAIQESLRTLEVERQRASMVDEQQLVVGLPADMGMQQLQESLQQKRKRLMQIALQESLKTLEMEKTRKALTLEEFEVACEESMSMFVGEERRRKGKGTASSSSHPAAGPLNAEIYKIEEKMVKAAFQERLRTQLSHQESVRLRLNGEGTSGCIAGPPDQGDANDDSKDVLDIHYFAGDAHNTSDSSCFSDLD